MLDVVPFPMLDLAPPIAALDDLRLIRFVGNPAAGRLVTPYQAPDVPFPIARVFTVATDRDGAAGGAHAHKRCHQLIICVAGSVEVAVLGDDAADRRAFTLDRPDVGLHVPPGLWAEQAYGPAGSVILVLCDRVYEAEDYLRDFAAYRRWRTAPGA